MLCRHVHTCGCAQAPRSFGTRDPILKMLSASLLLSHALSEPELLTQTSPHHQHSQGCHLHTAPNCLELLYVVGADDATLVLRF